MWEFSWHDLVDLVSQKTRRLIKEARGEKWKKEDEIKWNKKIFQPDS